MPFLASEPCQMRLHAAQLTDRCVPGAAVTYAQQSTGVATHLAVAANPSGRNTPQRRVSGSSLTDFAKVGHGAVRGEHCSPP